MENTFISNRNIILIFSFFISLFAQAQVNYTEITPNHIIYEGCPGIDINNDGFIDVSFSYQYCNGGAGNIFHLTSLQLINAQSTAEGSYIDNYSVNDSINEYCEWLPNTYSILQDLGSNYCDGNWCDGTYDGFIALKITADNQTYYGWVRIYILEGEYHHLAVASYAYNSTPNEPILAGEGIQNGANSVIAFDEYNYSDGRDINLSFTKAIDESKLSEYRIMLAKADDENANDLEFLNQLTEEYYYSIPTGNGVYSRLSFNLTENTKTIDGDEITAFIDYKIIIVNVSEDGNPEANTLAEPSNIFQLNTPPQAINRITAIDIDNNGNSSDIKVNFYEQEENPPIIEYRVFISKTVDSINFTATYAEELNQEYYTSVETTNSQEYSIRINPNQTDISGNEIIEGEFYSIFILSVADDIVNYTNVLSEPSRKIILDTPNRFYAGQKNSDYVSWHPCDSLFTENPIWGGEIAGEVNTNYIDVNRDGIDDFELFLKSKTEYYQSFSIWEYLLSIISLRENKVLTSEEGNLLEVLNVGDVIGDEYHQSQGDLILYSRTKKTYNDGVVDYDHIIGQYPDMDYYIGLMIDDSLAPQNAWIKLNQRSILEYAYQDLSSSLQEQEKQNQYSIFPNPSIGTIHIKAPTEQNYEVSIIIHNSMGKKIDEKALQKTNQVINMTNYPSGLYFIVIKEEGKILETHKIVIE